MLKQLFLKKLSLLISALLLFAFPFSAKAMNCPACGAENMPDLVMLCPECGANMYDYAYENKGTDRSALIIRLYYTGNNPNKLADYAKLYINGNYKGNIELTEKQSRKRLKFKADIKNNQVATVSLVMFGLNLSQPTVKA